MKHNNQIEAFEAVYKRYKAKCILTWSSLQKWKVFMYPHILPKWSYPSLKTEDMNIVLVWSIELHEEVDRIVKRIRDDIWVRELIRMIKDWIDIAPMIKQYR